MSLFMFEVTQAAPRVVVAPSAQALVAMVAASELPQGNVGGWVGRPRVTRKGGVIDNLIGAFDGSPQNHTTTVAAYEVPDGTSLHRTVAILTAVRDRLAINVRRIDGIEGPWGDVSVSRHSEPTNGSVTWWRDGSAARTTTEERFPSLTTDADENPRGPTGADTHPTTPAETLESLARKANAAVDSGTSLLWALAAAGTAGVAAYGLYLYQTARAAAPTGQPTKQPAEPARPLGERLAAGIRHLTSANRRST